MVITSGTLVFIAGALANLSRHLSKSGDRIQALALASGKILEWEEMLRHGQSPLQWSRAGSFEGYPELEWRAEPSSSPLDDSLYELEFKVLRRGRSEPLVEVQVEGRKRSAEEVAALEKEESLGENPPAT